MRIYVILNNPRILAKVLEICKNVNLEISIPQTFNLIEADDILIITDSIIKDLKVSQVIISNLDEVYSKIISLLSILKSDLKSHYVVLGIDPGETIECAITFLNMLIDYVITRNVHDIIRIILNLLNTLPNYDVIVRVGDGMHVDKVVKTLRDTLHNYINKRIFIEVVDEKEVKKYKFMNNKVAYMISLTRGKKV